MSDQPLQLKPHPAHPADGVTRLNVSAVRAGEGLSLRYGLHADLARLKISTEDGGARRDGLWQATCFELFVRLPDTQDYLEFNFAPNGDWAAYHFTGLRDGRTDLSIAAPRIETDMSAGHLLVKVDIDRLPPRFTNNSLSLGPTAILEAKDGQRSYWALHHPSNKPDFHRSETFQLNLD